MGKEGGWGASRGGPFDSLLTPEDARLVGSAEQVAEKMPRRSEALGEVRRFAFQMDIGALPHVRLMWSIEWIGEKEGPVVQLT